MVVFSRSASIQPTPSKYLPREIEDELRHLVLDGVEDFEGTAPQLIIGNLHSGCHGLYFHRWEGVEFLFQHCKMRFTNGCNCLVQTARREMTHQIPSYLDEYRVRLILGDNVPFQLEPKFAAMVVMKIFLGLEVPEQLRIETAAETNDPKMNLEKQGEKSGSNKGKGKQMGKILEEEQGDKSERVDIKDEEKEGEESK